MYPLKFEPILKQTLWGGDKIIPFKHLNETLPNVGESWCGQRVYFTRNGS